MHCLLQQTRHCHYVMRWPGSIHDNIHDPNWHTSSYHIHTLISSAICIDTSTQYPGDQVTQVWGVTMTTATAQLIVSSVSTHVHVCLSMVHQSLTHHTYTQTRIGHWSIYTKISYNFLWHMYVAYLYKLLSISWSLRLKNKRCILCSVFWVNLLWWLRSDPNT